MTQNERIIKYLRDFGTITTLEAVLDLGILRLGARISELRKQGWKIKDKFETTNNRYNEKVSYKKYWLEEEEQCSMF